jgi:hypothetical protein
MRKPCPSSRSLHLFLLVSVVALSFLAGCGKLRRLFAFQEPENPHSVTVQWTPGKTPVAGYNVYRESQFSGPIKLTTRIVSGTQYTDKTAQGGRTYSYFVTSVDSRGLESVPSEKTTVTVPTTITPPAKQ